MNDNIKIALTFQEYLDIVDFHSLPEREKIAYLLFYVTQLTKLRDDMIPEIITERINDQLIIENKKYSEENNPRKSLKKTEDIEKVIKENPSYFEVSDAAENYSDRGLGKTPYVLSKSKKDELSKEFNTEVRNIIRKVKLKSVFEKLWILFTLIALVLIFAYVYLTAETKNSPADYSWNEYLDYTNFSEIDDYQKGIYILYYITAITKLNDSMLPETIYKRLQSLHYSPPSEKDLEKYLDDSPWVESFNTPSNEKTYKISPLGKIEIPQVMKLNEQKRDLTAIWILRNASDETLLGLVSGIFFIFVLSFGWGFKLAKMIK